MSVICECCKKKMYENLTSIHINEFINSTYERTGDKKDRIQAKDIYDEFQQTESWILLKKTEKRIWNKRKFINALYQSMKIGLDFKDKFQEKGTTIRSVFINWRKK